MIIFIEKRVEIKLVSFLPLEMNTNVEHVTLTHAFDGHWAEAIKLLTSHPLWLVAVEICGRGLRGRELINSVEQLSSLDADLAVCEKGQMAMQYFYMVLSGNGNYDQSNQIDAFPILVFLSLLPRE